MNSLLQCTHIFERAKLLDKEPSFDLGVLGVKDNN